MKKKMKMKTLVTKNFSPGFSVMVTKT